MKNMGWLLSQLQTYRKVNVRNSSRVRFSYMNMYWREAWTNGRQRHRELYTKYRYMLERDGSFWIILNCGFCFPFVDLFSVKCYTHRSNSPATVLPLGQHYLRMHCGVCNVRVCAVFWLQNLGDTLGLMGWQYNSVYGIGMAEKPSEFMMIEVSFGGF